jgi:hypothetical protein
VTVSVEIGVSVSVGVKVKVGVSVAVSAGTSVSVDVNVSVSVGVSVEVIVGVKDKVGVYIAADARMLLAILIINCGGLAPSRLEKLVAVALVVSITKLYWPAPLTTEVTSTCVHILAVIAPELPIFSPMAGALLKLMVNSSHVPVELCTV